MLGKLLNWLFGEKIISSAVGLAAGAAVGVAPVLMSGNISKEAVISGAAVGLGSALIGSIGRTTGEKK